MILKNKLVNRKPFYNFKKINKYGYVIIYYPEHPNATKNGFVLEHRYVVEKKLGRYLDNKETVHHINGDKTDNRIQNLMLFKSQKEHKSFENKIRRFGFTKPILRYIKNRWVNKNDILPYPKG